MSEWTNKGTSDTGKITGPKRWWDEGGNSVFIEVKRSWKGGN